MKNANCLFMPLLVLSILCIIPNQKLSAQTGIECLGCGGMNGNHKPGCPYINKSINPASSATNISFEQQIMGAIFTNMFNSLLNSGSDSKQTEAEKLRQQQEQQLRQQRLSAMIALQKKYNDSVAQASHDKMMKEYKKLDGGGDLAFKSLDEDKWKPSAHFSCKITSFKGDVKVIKTNGKMIPLTQYQAVDLEPGDWLATGPNSRVKLHYDFESGGEDIMLGQKSAINIVTDEFGTHVPKFVRGNYYVTNNIVAEKYAEYQEELIAETNKLRNKLDKKFNIRTPTCALAVRGTEFTVNVDSTGKTIVCVFEGIVELTDPNHHALVTLTARTKGIVKDNGAISGPFTMKDEEKTNWWKED
ncbi:MAG: FecR domain-containing protein [Methanococcaceae archaeon]